MSEFEKTYEGLLMDLKYRSTQVPQAYWQSQRADVRPGMEYSVECRHKSLVVSVGDDPTRFAQAVNPNLPWAEDHFQERVSGIPHNPPPSEAWWPFRVKNNSEHKDTQEQFSHTYPERIWPKFANRGTSSQYMAPAAARRGIRYFWGDLDDVVAQLTRDPLTRQAYLPIWFPEDTGALSGQRVPCTLGYHFIFRPLTRWAETGLESRLHGEIIYYIRSCDAFRHLRDDVYMAGRLLQWVVGKLRDREINATASTLIMHITSLHVFRGDEPKLDLMVRQIHEREEDDRIYGTTF